MFGFDAIALAEQGRERRDICDNARSFLQEQTVDALLVGQPEVMTIGKTLCEPLTECVA